MDADSYRKAMGLGPLDDLGMIVKNITLDGSDIEVVLASGTTFRGHGDFPIPLLAKSMGLPISAELLQWLSANPKASSLPG